MAAEALARLLPDPASLPLITAARSCSALAQLLIGADAPTQALLPPVATADANWLPELAAAGEREACLAHGATQRMLAAATHAPETSDF